MTNLFIIYFAVTVIITALAAIASFDYFNNRNRDWRDDRETLIAYTVMFFGWTWPLAGLAFIGWVLFKYPAAMVRDYYGLLRQIYLERT